MKKSIRCIALVLVLCLIFSAAGTVTAVGTWEDVIKRYDSLFAVTDEEPAAKFKELYNALLLDPRTFTNQLAFRNAETKEYILSVLTGDCVTPEQLENMEEAILILLRSVPSDTPQAENTLWLDMLDRFAYLSLRDVGTIRDCKWLFAQVAAEEEDYIYMWGTALSEALIGTPDAFLRALSEEEEAVQERVLLLLERYSYDFIGTKICNSLPQYDSDTDPESAALRKKILDTLRTAPQLNPQTDPDPSELKQWQVQGYFPQPTTTYRYSGLLNIKLGVRTETFVTALLTDTANCVNELAFRDVKTKRALLDGIAQTYAFSKATLRQISLHLQAYLAESTHLTKSETALLEAYIYQLDYIYYSRSHAHRDNTVLFAEAVERPIDQQLNDFCDELKLAFADYPGGFIYSLVQEEETVQDTVGRYLCEDSDTSDALLIIVAQLLAEEHDRASHYSDAEYALLLKICSNIQMLPTAPALSEPDPAEHAQWLVQKQLLEEGPDAAAPTDTTPLATEPSETTVPEETLPAPDDAPEKDAGWISTVCFALGFLCLGIAAGSLIAKKRKAKNAPAQSEPVPQEPVRIYPKLLYCPAPLSRDIQKQIALALREKYDEYSVHWYSIKQIDGTCRCYGTDDGYDIIFYAGGLRMEIPASYTIGECTFLFETSFELYAHKDGTLTDLNAALEQDLVSRQAVCDALAKHKSISN